MTNLKNFLKLHPKKCLIFDLDRTLVDLDINWSGFRDNFFQIVAKEIDAQLSTTLPNFSGQAQTLYNQAIIDHGYSAKQVVDQFCNNWEEKNLGSITENSKLTNFIRNHSEHQYFIWTGNNLSTANLALSKINLKNKIRKIIAKESTNLSKPFPDGFYSIIEPNSFNRKDYLMIGDSNNDKLAATNAGIDFFQIEPFKKT